MLKKERRLADHIDKNPVWREKQKMCRWILTWAGRLRRIYSMPKKTRRKLTRTEQRDLDIEIGFLEGVVQRDPQYVEALQVLGDNYTRRGKFVDGMKIDERLSRLMPDDPMVLYNLACSYSLARRIEQAATALLRALDRGYKDHKWLLKDPDLQNLRKHAIFKSIRARLRSRRISVK